MLAKFKEGDIINYITLARNLLESLYQFKKHGHRRKISDKMQGESLAVLFILSKKNIASPSEMSTEMNISSARVAAMLNSLEEKGLVTRQIDKADRRKILVNLTEKGQVLAEKHSKEVEGHAAKLLEQLGEHDASELVRIVERIAFITFKASDDE